MRYEIGEVIYGIHFGFEGMLPKNCHMFLKPTGPYFDKVKIVTIKKLVVIEHHKVRWMYDTDEQEARYDGYILKDEKGDRWVNQYPRASYGQLSDTADRIFTKRDAMSDKEHAQEPIQFYSLPDFITEISDAIKSLDKDDKYDFNKSKNKYLSSFVELKEKILKQLKEEHNVELKEVSVFDDMPEITRFEVA